MCAYCPVLPYTMKSNHIFTRNMRPVLQAELPDGPQEQRAQLAASLGSLLDVNEEEVHWLHGHPEEAMHLLSLFGIFGRDQRLLLLHAWST